MIDPAIYAKYKPLRNALRGLGVTNAFYVVWSFVNLMQFKQVLPPDVNASPEFLDNPRSPSRGLYEWELSLLSREVISNGSSSNNSSIKDLRVWNNLCSIINKIKDFEDGLWPIISDDGDIHDEIRRIAHRQFPWQTRPGFALFFRYYKIYNYPGLEEIIESRIGLSAHEWFQIGLALSGTYLKQPSTSIDLTVELGNVDINHFERFLSYTCIDLEEMKALIDREVKYDDEFVYTLNPMEYYPIVRLDQRLWCPVINYLVWRTTSGLFFDLVADPNFGHPFGLAFQQYLEDVSFAVLSTGTTQVVPESKYSVGKDTKDSVDLILSDENCAVFVEAKAKRLQAKSKSQLRNSKAIAKDLDVLADDVVQVYKTINDFLQGHYQHFDHTDGMSIYPFVVTLEEWFLIGDDRRALAEGVRTKLLQEQLPQEFLEDMPFTICASSTYEYFIQVIGDETVPRVMSMWHAEGNEGNDFGQFIRTEYHGRYKQVTDFFPDTFKSLFIENQ